MTLPTSNRRLTHWSIATILTTAIWTGTVQTSLAQTNDGNQQSVLNTKIRRPPAWEDIDFESLYDADRVITVRGPITAFWHFPLGERRTGVVVRIHVQGEFAHVYLGSLEFLTQNNLELSINDYVSLQGNRALLRHRGIIVVADAIKKGDAALRLRDDRGRPRW